METELKKVNVAPTSDSGHFIEGAIQVVDLDKITETFLVEGKSKLTTKNHTTLNLEEDCIITCQMVYNPFNRIMERSKD